MANAAFLKIFLFLDTTSCSLVDIRRNVLHPSSGQKSGRDIEQGSPGTGAPSKPMWVRRHCDDYWLLQGPIQEESDCEKQQLLRQRTGDAGASVKNKNTRTVALKSAYPFVQRTTFMGVMPYSSVVTYECSGGTRRLPCRWRHQVPPYHWQLSVTFRKSIR
jgi:hypothetical protein